MNLFQELDKFADNLAVITEQDEYKSYKDLLEVADDIGHNIDHRCLIFVICKNDFESMASYIGFLRAGAVVALIDKNIDVEFLTDLLETYKPAYIFAPDNYPGLNSNHLSQILSGTINYSCGKYALYRTCYNIDYLINDDLALLLTTSGSTGTVKLVRQSYKNIYSNAHAIIKYLNITNLARPITSMPMNYTYGLSIINSHLLSGACIVLSEATLMQRKFWQTIKQHKVTTFGGVPFTYEMLKKLRFAEMELPTLKYITQAGGKLDKDLCVEFTLLCRKKGIDFIVMYGQTEATARISYLPLEHAVTKAGSIGIAIPGGKLWLENKEGEVIKGVNQPGELVYQGENVTLGYAKSYLDLVKGDENRGILFTGDIAHRDADGFYYVVGRAKRFLKIYGKRVNLDELEHLLKKQGYECVCVGTDDKLKIYVTDKSHLQNATNFILTRIGINKRGFDLHYLAKIPRKESGKIIYSNLE